MTDIPHLLSIGEFSSRSRLSVRMLRHYDAHGVLVPALLDALIDHGDIPMSITVTRHTVPARTLVGLRGTVPAYDREGELWARFMPELAAQGLTPVGPGGVIENDPDYREADVDETVWLPVAPGTTVRSPLLLLDLPAMEVAMADVTGPYTLITEAHARIEDFLREEGLSVAARDGEAPVEQRVFNVYLNDPSQAAPEELRTQVCVPLA
ncbi:effector-binding domain-containing protein [Austwickia chelonae]|uniref:Putative transcriptional regulator n=1 Tax=Austwickia chelonae NBRC 105200 TaxID=1184607 RepID=K6W6S6_9MICO|nr:MerR family transcriptional regulator [Austwickia chelonae]GAB77517.1 putative transcriptional regulator [Austwickia chelonae NBRC 105200]SEW11988.1 effector-binding domain-containing protein [Austwickia chelonae]